jgi:hypothetical protein
MQGHFIHLLIGSSVMVASFLLMTCVGRPHWIYAIGLAGSVLHLIGVFHVEVFNIPNLFLDLFGVTLVCISSAIILRNSIARMNGGHA